MAIYCQKCRLPLKLDSSLQNLNPAAYDLLVGSYFTTFPEIFLSHYTYKSLVAVPRACFVDSDPQLLPRKTL